MVKQTCLQMKENLKFLLSNRKGKYALSIDAVFIKSRRFLNIFLYSLEDEQIFQLGLIREK